MPPRNPEDFANFVARLAQRYRGRVSRYSLENEAHSPANWPASPESYFSLLGVFQRAVRAGDPDALVEDGGFASDALGVLVAADMAAGGRRKEAADFAGRYFSRFGPAPAGLSAFRENKDAGLETLVGTAHARRLSRWAALFFANNRLYDAVQLHYFAPADLLPEATSWVRERLRAAGGEKPVEFWQAGHGWSDRRTYDENLHAAEVVKGVVSALGEGALRVVNWQFTDAAAAAGMPGLFTARGPRPAAEAFRRTAGLLNGTSRADRLPSGKGIRAYRFIAPAGEIVAVWADRPCRVRLPGMSERVVVTDPSGNFVTVRSDAVPVSDVPVFVENVNEETLQTRAEVRGDAG